MLPRTSRLGGRGAPGQPGDRGTSGLHRAGRWL